MSSLLPGAMPLRRPALPDPAVLRRTSSAGAEPGRSVAAIALAAVAAACLVLGGCAVLGSGATFGGETTLTVSVASDLNRDFPVPVEVVYAYQKKLAAEVLALSASQWFAGREQFARDHPGGDYRSWYWEWVPGQAIPPQELEYAVGAQDPIVFVGYSSPGDHRQQVPLSPALTLTLGRDDFTLKSGR